MAHSIAFGGIVLALGYGVYDTYFKDPVIAVKSSVDNRTYVVRNSPNAQLAADVLGTLAQKLEALQEHMIKKFPDDPRAQSLKTRMKADKISENAGEQAFTSYTKNKSEIVMCLTTRDDENKVHDIQTLLFVALHEAAHVAEETVGHTPEFWETFKWILTEAAAIGIYEPVDYSSAPKDYCGTTITDNPIL